MLYFRHRYEWLLITMESNQAISNILKFPAQQIVSGYTGIKGTKTAGRGYDLSDNSESKSCSRIDQVDECVNCKSLVFRYESVCQKCGSSKIRRKKDSKWLFSISDECMLNEFLTNPIYLLLTDYPKFKKKDYNDVCIQLFLIDPRQVRHKQFCNLLERYYHKNVVPKKLARKEIAAFNFWPDRFMFYICNPIQLFQIIVTNINSNPTLEVQRWIDPDTDMKTIPAINMPPKLLSDAYNELQLLKDNGFSTDIISEDARLFLPLRPYKPKGL